MDNDKPMSSELPVSSSTPIISESPIIISNIPRSSNSAISSNIPANTSVNVAWGSRMCEANGYVYFVSRQSDETQNPKAEIVRMNQDGTGPAVVTDKYYYISKIAADSNNLYFAARAESDKKDTLYSLALDGGTARKITDGYIGSLQMVKGKLYWVDYTYGFSTIQFKCVNPDGSDLKTLINLNASTSNEGPFNFLVTESGIYYSKSTVNNSDYYFYSDVYYTDLSGENAVKLNRDPVRCVYAIFYDQGNIYFLVDNDSSAEPFTSSFVKLDKEGKTQTLLNRVGYYPQGPLTALYCGISNGIIYYFMTQPSDSASAKIYLDLHQYDINKNKDDLILGGVDFGASDTGTVTSLRGKSFESTLWGMYILGNDVYFGLYLPVFVRVP